MDHFFSSVSSLMSLNLHSAVYSSIDDLVQFIEMYKLGNDFTGHFERSLPVLPQPITLTVVRHHFISPFFKKKEHFVFFCQVLETQVEFGRTRNYVGTLVDSSCIFFGLKNNRKYFITDQNPACFIVKFCCYLNLYTHWN